MNQTAAVGLGKVELIKKFPRCDYYTAWFRIFHCKCSRQQKRWRTIHSKVVVLAMSFTKITTAPFGKLLLDYGKTTTRQRTRNQKVSIEFINLLVQCPFHSAQQTWKSKKFSWDHRACNFDRQRVLDFSSDRNFLEKCWKPKVSDLLPNHHLLHHHSALLRSRAGAFVHIFVKDRL